MPELNPRLTFIKAPWNFNQNQFDWCTGEGWFWSGAAMIPLAWVTSFLFPYADVNAGLTIYFSLRHEAFVYLVASLAARLLG